MDPKNQEPLIRHVLSKMSTYNAIIHKSTCNGTKSHFVLCQEHLKGRHTHPKMTCSSSSCSTVQVYGCAGLIRLNIKKGLGLAGKPKDPR